MDAPGGIAPVNSTALVREPAPPATRTPILGGPTPTIPADLRALLSPSAAAPSS